MKAAVYLRESLDRHGDELAISRQRDDCLRLCHQRGWEPVEYAENDTSANGRKARPVYGQMLADICSGAIGAVVAWDADRLHRVPRELEDFIDLADQYGLALATIGGDFDLSTPTGRGNARMRGVFSRMEMEQKSWRQKRAAKQRAEGGGAWWPSRPFGFQLIGADGVPDADDADWSPTGKTIAAHPVEAQLVREAYTAVLAGDALHAIAATWNERGATTPKGSIWRGAQVRQLLINPRNAALRSYGGEVVGPASWPALVTRDVWEGVCAVLADPKRRYGATRGRKHLLSGLALCGKCGHPMGSSISQSGPVYTCKSGYHLSRSLAKVDELVTDWVVGRLEMPDAAELLLAEKHDGTAELRDRARALRVRMDQLATDFADGDLTASQLKAATVRIKEQLAQLDSQMLDSNRARVFDTVIGAHDVRSALAALSLDRRRAIVEALVAVTILPSGRGRAFDPDLVRIEWRDGRSD
ncbi:recombinase family protein [Mycolicibacterium hippocampi]|uniref:Serine recombinase n=1 Tax=Mycolicibacterium hippocampi TaxID=659824 RepID=A0A7I9ZQT6_9MYCO|nr:recombinase family protein [Mycolicibacterium hippocampi]GFH03392.1 serine recombinase [Mycolicibacterium hippocampi]